MPVERADAAEWLPARLSETEPGTVLVVFHSVMWQYLGTDTQNALRAALAGAGAGATPETPLAWLRMEPHPETYAPAELRLTLWDGGSCSPRERLLATTGFHGGALTWLA